MQFEYSFYVVPLIFSALISIFVAVYAWLRRSTPSALALSVLALVIAEWSLGYALEIAGTDLATKYFWGKLQYVGIAVAPLFWLIFAFNHANRANLLPRRQLLLLAVIPFITILLALTTEWNGLIWQEVSVSQGENFSTIQVISRGLWFWVHFVYSYVLLAAGTYIVARSIGRLKGLYRGQTVALVIALLAPWLGNALFFLGLSPIPNLDPTPFAFTITVAGLAWGIFGFRLVDVSPVARDMVVEGLRDGMLVLDARHRVADINPAASRIIGLPVDFILGKPIVDVLAPWPQLLERFLGVTDEVREEITIGQDQAERRYEVRISPLEDRQQNRIGSLIIVRKLDLSLPEPRYASREPFTRPAVVELTSEPGKPSSSNQLWGRIVAFFVPDVQKNSNSFRDSHPIWSQTIERIFTMIVRIVAFLGTSAFLTYSFLFSAPQASFTAVLTVIIAAFWLLGLLRNLTFVLRVGIFLFMVYALAFTEMANYGYSPESFAFFLTFITMAALLTDLRGGIWALLVGIFTMATFGVLIGLGLYQPLDVQSETISRSVIGAGVTMTAFSASAIGLVVAINALLTSLNKSWQKETQALNLLQQERDLLEQRVIERTTALAEARDLAVQSSSELRKYFLAIEQSGNVVVITDTKGDIEYANPRFELVTGYSLAEALGKNLRILKSGAQSPEFYAQMWKTIISGQIWRGELQNQRKDNSLYWELATIAPVQNKEGVVTNYVAIKEDITIAKELQQKLKKQNDYLSILHQTTLDLLNRQNIEELLNVVVERACILLDAPLGEIMLKQGDYMTVRAFTKNQPYLVGDKVDRTQVKLTWKAHDTGQPVVLEDYVAWSGHRDIYDANPLHAIADFPVMVGAECIGVLALGRTQEHYPFTSDQIETGILFSQLVALVLDNANLYDSALEEIEQRKRAEERNLRFVEDMKSLQEIHLELSQLQESEQLYIQMIEFTQRRLGLDRVGLFLLDEASHSIIGTYGVQPDGRVRNERYYREKIIPNHWTMEVVNALNHTKIWENAPLYDNYGVVGTGWKVASALWNGQKAIGYLVCDNLLTGRAPRSYELELVSLLGSTFGHLIERNQNQLLLQESETRFRQIVENASDIIYRADAEGHFTYINPTALNVMRFKTEAEVLGRSYLELATPQWTTKLKRFYVRQFLKGEENTYFEFQAFTQDGHEVWLGQNVQIIWENDKVAGFQAVARDITRLKQAQDALAIARDQALDASRFKSQLLAKVSHELRTPLGGVIGYAELLQNAFFGKLSNDEQKDAVDNIVDSANYLSTMIGELLDQAQIEARSVQLRVIPFSPIALIEQTLAVMDVLAKNKSLNLKHSIVSDLPATLYGDPKRLQQILINLTGNAIKFTMTGHVQIDFLRPDSRHWIMRVSDTGAGIPKEAQAYIFEPFRQVDNAITHYNRGTGLGLSITKQLVELMGGNITLESEVDKGSTFTISLPILEHPLEQ